MACDVRVLSKGVSPTSPSNRNGLAGGVAVGRHRGREWVRATECAMGCARELWIRPTVAGFLFILFLTVSRLLCLTIDEFLENAVRTHPVSDEKT